MFIDTTISITNDNFLLLKYLSKSSNSSISEIINKAIKLASSKSTLIRSHRHTTQYQPKADFPYCRLHLYLLPHSFNIALDLRRFYKASLSLIIAEILNNHYNELLTLLNETDNYLTPCHCQIYFETENARCWKHFWGIPKPKELEPG